MIGSSESEVTFHHYTVMLSVFDVYNWHFSCIKLQRFQDQTYFKLFRHSK